MPRTGAARPQASLELLVLSTRLRHHSPGASRLQARCYLRWFEVWQWGPICFNQIHRIEWSPWHYFLLVLNLPQWMWHLHDIVEIDDNIDVLVVFVAGLMHRQRKFSVVIESTDERDGEFNLYRLHFIPFFSGYVVQAFHQFEGVCTPFTDASCNTGFPFAGCTLLGTAAVRTVVSGPAAST